MHTHTLDAPDHRELDDPFCLTDDVAVRLLADAPWRRLAVIGDSIAEGLGDPVDGYRDLPWAERLADGLSAAVGDLSYLNLGVRGLTAGEIRRTQLTDALAFSPDLAVCPRARTTCSEVASTRTTCVPRSTPSSGRWPSVARWSSRSGSSTSPAWTWSLRHGGQRSGKG
jgi:hypothetical protein